VKQSVQGASDDARSQRRLSCRQRSQERRFNPGVCCWYSIRGELGNQPRVIGFDVPLKLNAE
jgi:hypothetical protein